MTDMPGNLARSKIMRELDYHRNESMVFRYRLLEKMMRGVPLVQAWSQLEVGSPPMLKHVREHFFSDDRPKAYWPYDQWGYLGNKEHTTRLGTIESILVAEGLRNAKIDADGVKARLAELKRRWPDADAVPENKIFTVWICAGKHYESYVTEMEGPDKAHEYGTRTVMHVMITPSYPDSANAQRTAPLDRTSKIDVIAHERELDGYLAYYDKKKDRKPKLRTFEAVHGKQAPRFARLLRTVGKGVFSMNKIDEG